MTSNTLTKLEIVSTTGEWRTPFPLNEVDPPIFPVDVLPGPGRDMVEQVVEQTQCELSIPGGCLLGVYALASQGRVVVNAGTQREETPLWIVPVAEVSERKSSVFSPMLLPIIDYQTAERERTKPLKNQADAIRDTLKARIEKLIKQAGNPDDEIKRGKDADEIMRLKNKLNETTEIFLPRYFADNITEEKLAVLMVENHDRMALVSSEPTLFQLMDGSRSRKPLLDIFLKAYSGESFLVDRITRESIILNRPLLTVITTAQTGPLRDFIKEKRFEERGILSRFLFFPCKQLAGTRFWKNYKSDMEIICQYEAHIYHMLQNQEEEILKVSQEAMEIYIQHYNWVELMQAPGRELHNDGWGGKQPGRALRIAAAFHRAENDKSGIISTDTMLRAIKLSNYCIEAYLHIQGTARESEDTKKLRILLDSILEKKKIVFRFSDIHNSVRRHFLNTDETRKFMGMLIENGDIRRYDVNKTESYMLNPFHVERQELYTDWET